MATSFIKPFKFVPGRKARHPRHITLVRPASIVSRVATAAPLTPPLGLVYIAGFLREAGHSIRLIDAVGEKLEKSTLVDKSLVRRGLSYDEVAEMIPPETDLIGISCMFSSEWPYAHQMIDVIHARWPDKPIIGGGEHLTATPEHSMETCPPLTACVLGEGEESMLQLIERFWDEEDLSQCPGVAWRDNDEKIHINPRMGRIRNIDDIPWPAWDLIPIEKYLLNGSETGVRHNDAHGRSMPLLATRGCPFRCTFCSNNDMWTTRWIPRDPEKLMDEIEHYVKRYKIDDVQFFDLTAIISKKWLLRFATAMKQRNLGITWQLPVGTRAEAIDFELGQALFSSGCFNMTFAPESGSPRTLKLIEKRVDLKQMARAMKECRTAGLNLKANIMLGFPEETHLDVWKTLRFILKMSLVIGIHDVSVYPFSPYPGSPLFKKLYDEGRLPVDTLSDRWYLDLNYAEFGGLQCSSQHFGTRAMRIYQLLGYTIFYSITFVARPMRLYKLIRNLITGKHESKGETIITLFLRRFLFSTYG